MGGEDAQARRPDQKGPQPPQDQGSHGEQARRRILGDHEMKLVLTGNKLETVAQVGGSVVCVSFSTITEQLSANDPNIRPSG